MKVKYTHSAMPFKQMENIATFLHALSKLQNFRSFDLFSTVDLYEGKNMSSVTRCILSCKRIAEKEALIRGIETLKVGAEDVKVQDLKETDVQVVEEEPACVASEVQEVESFEEIESSEPIDQISEQEQEFEEFDHPAHEQTVQIIEPEIVLIDSPVFADDESEPLVREDRESTGEFEEYETFTMENPGTFEIQVTDQ